jgi:hypothetical protein
MDISAEATRELRSNEIKLAAVSVPAGVDASTAAQITTAIDRSFVYGFRAVMLICVVLSLFGAVFAWRLIARDVSSP